MKNKKFVRVVDIKFNDRFYLEQDIKTMAKQVLDVTKPKAKDIKYDLEWIDSEIESFMNSIENGEQRDYPDELLELAEMVLDKFNLK